MANTASSPPTTHPAAAPAIRPSHTDPEALATMAATNAPSSNWPSMPMLTTPDREQITPVSAPRSEEHTSELQSQFHLVGRLLLEKKNDLAIRHDLLLLHGL